MHPATLPGRFIAMLGLLAACSLAAEAGALRLPEAVRSELRLASFYVKYVDAGGVAVVSSAKVSDFALLEARHLILQMTSHRPELRRALAQHRVRFAIMAPDEFTTAIPEHSDLRPVDYWDQRARGLGASQERPAVSCGEENLLGYAGDPYAAENILLHEFGHALHGLGLRVVDPTFEGRLQAAFAAARREGLWLDTYAATSPHEYWAEGVQSWFDSNRENDAVHNAVNTRAELKSYDPRLAALLREVFGDGAWRYEPPAKRSPASPHLAGFDARHAPRFVWPARLATYRISHQETEMLTPALTLAPLPSDSRADWRSPGDTPVQTVLDFENSGPVTVTVDWIDYDGRAKNYYTLRSGEARRSGTFVGHVWRATDDTGAVLGYYVAREFPALAVVQTRAEAKTRQEENPTGAVR